MSLKINPKIGIYDLSFKAAVKSLIKDGFISQELIDSLYTKCADFCSEHLDMTVDEYKAILRSEYSPWVWLLHNEYTNCVKLKPYGTDANGEVLYIYGGHTRKYQEYNDNLAVKWRGRYGTLEQIRDFEQKQNPNKTFVTVCHRNSEGVLEPVGYVI